MAIFQNLAYNGTNLDSIQAKNIYLWVLKATIASKVQNSSF